MRHQFRSTAAWLMLLLTFVTAHATTLCGFPTRTTHGRSEIDRRLKVLDDEYREFAARSLAQDYSGGSVCDYPRTQIYDFYCNKLSTGQVPYGYYYTALPSGMKLHESVVPDLGIYWQQLRGTKGVLYREHQWYDIYLVEAGARAGNRVRGKVDGGVDPDRPGGMLGVCWKITSYIAYLNGVFATPVEAKNGLDALESEFGSEYEDTPLEYQFLYNQTTCSGEAGLSCLGDLAEVFSQRQKLLHASLANRWEVFWDIVSGRESTPGSSTHGLTEKLGSLFGGFILDLSGSIRNKALRLTTALFSRPTTAADELKFRTQLFSNGVGNRGSTVVVAHSQGNLFAPAINQKYQQVMGSQSSHPFPSVSFVHVAPPTNSLVGPYVLANIDLVIRGLGAMVPGSTPPTNASLPLSNADLWGHGFVETYWDKSRPAYEMVRKLITDALGTH